MQLFGSLVFMCLMSKRVNSYKSNTVKLTNILKYLILLKIYLTHIFWFPSFPCVCRLLGQSEPHGGFILPDLAKGFDLCIFILGSYEGQKPISYRILAVRTVKLTSDHQIFCKKFVFDLHMTSKSKCIGQTFWPSRVK